VVRQSVAPPARLASRRVLMGGLATSRVTLGDGVVHNDPGGIDSIGILEIDISGGSNTHKRSQPSFGAGRTMRRPSPEGLRRRNYSQGVGVYWT
jgi:hypothetical protein